MNFVQIAEVYSIKSKESESCELPKPTLWTKTGQFLDAGAFPHL